MKIFLFLFSAFVVSGCGIGLCTQIPCHGFSQVPKTLFELTPSFLHRNFTTPQMTLAEELALGPAPLPSGYREIPLLAKDDEGVTGPNVDRLVRPTVVCGTTQTSIEQRISHCATANGSNATWDGTKRGNGPQAVWRLVTFTGTYDIWRDERTQLIWSASLGPSNWCQASGSSGGGPFGEVDPVGYCDGVFQDQTTPLSLCFEAPGLNTPSSYDEMKGGMRAAATATSPSVIWRLPTRWDYHQADVDGIRLVLLYGAGEHFWSATVRSDNLFLAWVLQTTNGVVGFSRESTGASTVCVGR